MKTKHLLLSALTGSLLATAAQAQLDVTITGSTAFRSVIFDRAQSLFDAGSFAQYGSGNTILTYFGTMSNSVPSVGNQIVYVRMSFSGSGSGMLSVANSSPVPTADSGPNVNKIPDIALSDVYPGAAAPPIDPSVFDPDSVLGVVPFVFAVHTNLFQTGITNITREQAYLLMTDSGIITNTTPTSTNIFYGMPQNFLGGSSTNPLYFISRDGGSGTRISVFRDVAFYGSPTCWTTNSDNTYVLTAGLTSGGLIGGILRNHTDAVGYLGLPDLINNTGGNGAALHYEGVPFSIANVQNGSYALWGKEHMLNRAGALSSAQQAVHDALLAAITNQGYQTTNVNYTLGFVDLVNMKVDRNDDGGPITRF